MANKYHVVVRPGTGRFEIESLVATLNHANPAFEDYGVNRYGDRVWAIDNEGPSPVRGWFDADRDGLVLEGSLSSVAPVALTIRRSMHPGARVEMCDHEYTWSTELEAGMTPAEICALE